jgi:GntR family transcriptional regulator
MAQPMYQQIAEDLRKQIESGALGRGSQLPTELELRERYKASRNTIRDAIKRLTGQGLVETRPGQGTFVTVKVDPFVTVLTADPGTGFGGGEGATYLSQVSAEHRKPFATTPKVEVQTPPRVITGRLRVPPATQVVSRHQERYIDDIPWSLQTSFYPMEFVTRGATRLLMAEDIAEGTVRYLAETIGLRQIGYRDWITARAPDDNEQKFFGISHASSVFEIFRTAFDQTKTPMRVTVTVFPADRNQFIVNVGDGLPDPRYDGDSGEPG